MVQLINTLEGHTSSVRSVAFSPDGATLVSGSTDNTIRIWRLSDGQLLDTLEGHTSYVLSVAFSPDGSTLASGSADNTIRIWRLSDSPVLDTLEGNAYVVRSIAFSPDGPPWLPAQPTIPSASVPQRWSTPGHPRRTYRLGLERGLLPGRGHAGFRLSR